MKHRLFLSVICFLLINSGFVFGQREDGQARFFDSYEWGGSDDAGARVDNFAVALANSPDMIGYVICYGPQGDGSGTGNSLLLATKSYLVNVRGIEPERIQTIYGGRYKKLTTVATEFWIAPLGADAPKPKRYKSKIEKITGKVLEYEGWDGFPDGAEGVSAGNVRLAAFADTLRQQPQTTAYIVAFNFPNSSPGTWRRIAKQEASELQSDGIESDRIKIIYGGITKDKGGGYNNSQSANVQLWILPSDAPPPLKEAAPERTPKEAVQIGAYEDYLLKYPDRERPIFEGFADVLRADRQLNVCIVIRPRIEGEERYTLPDEPPDIDPQKLAEKWKMELMEKFGVEEKRIILLPAASDEFHEGLIEVWVVPPGAPLPDLYATDDAPSEQPDDPQEF